MPEQGIGEPPRMPHFRDSWKPLRPMNLNRNLDDTMFELDLMTRGVAKFLSDLQFVVVYQAPNKPVADDFDWFVSSDLSDYRGKYIAVYDKQIIGVGETSLEAEQKAKIANPAAKPALTYIPETEDVVFWYSSFRVAAS